MRTTIDIPETLLNDAMKASHVKTKTMAVILGLKELLHRHQIEKLRGMRGRVNIAVNVQSSRKR
jgi:Arc/MetJ family transcription regulator